ncbi:hypothetical protein BT246_51140 [Bacillus thuringiensis]|uniref:Uncharacterized protein n=1 Tax=Bacillus thuringiensis TaxID=1428 RepID=A0A9W3SG28_BACTU|nr:hypothetical protein BT246_51140 [Bacillus thuringiensis]
MDIVGVIIKMVYMLIHAVLVAMGQFLRLVQPVRRGQQEQQVAQAQREQQVAQAQWGRQE